MKAVITGASSGLGRDFALLLCKRGYEVYAVARREDRLNALKSEAGEKLIPIVLDLSAEEGCKTLCDAVKNEKIDILINNAGFGAFGAFTEIPLEREMQLLDINVRAVHILTKLFVKKMLEDGSGRILNVASSAGFMMGPMLSAYYASKAYVLRLTQAVDEEVRRKNPRVRLSVLCPGPVKTEFDAVAEVKFSLKGLDSRFVADYALKKLSAGKRVIIPGFTMKLLIFMTRFVPQGLLSKITYHAQKKKGDAA